MNGIHHRLADVLRDGRVPELSRDFFSDPVDPLGQVNLTDQRLLTLLC